MCRKNLFTFIFLKESVVVYFKIVSEKLLRRNAEVHDKRQAGDTISDPGLEHRTPQI
jgi:hypothetical protein